MILMYCKTLRFVYYNIILQYLVVKMIHESQVIVIVPLAQV